MYFIKDNFIFLTRPKAIFFEEITDKIRSDKIRYVYFLSSSDC